MRDPSASFESSAAWMNPQPEDGFPTRSDKAKSVSRVMLALGVALLVFVPLGGALFLLAGGLGLVIASEAPLSPPTNR